jgi:hypothetical protein
MTVVHIEEACALKEGSKRWRCECVVGIHQDNSGDTIVAVLKYLVSQVVENVLARVWSLNARVTKMFVLTVESSSRGGVGNRLMADAIGRSHSEHAIMFAA